MRPLARCQRTKPECKPHLLLSAGCLVPGSRTASKSRPTHIPLPGACKPRPHPGQLCPAKCQQTQTIWHGATHLHTWGWAEVCSSSSQERGEMWEQLQGQTKPGAPLPSCRADLPTMQRSTLRRESAVLPRWVGRTGHQRAAKAQTPRRAQSLLQMASVRGSQEPSGLECSPCTVWLFAVPRYL